MDNLDPEVCTFTNENGCYIMKLNNIFHQSDIIQTHDLITKLGQINAF